MLPSFNDDIQGTGAVAAASVHAACRISGRAFRDSRIVIYGAGAAGLGIARQLRGQLQDAGLQGDELKRAIIAIDSRGVVSADRPGLDDFKKELAWPAEMVAQLELAEDEHASLAKVVSAYKATVLIGTSGQGGSFTEEIVKRMSANTEHPVILPMSNPTSISEGVPQDIYDWSNGKALIATGSPFDPIETSDGPRRIGQANTVFVFPGIGLGSIVSGATEITSTMIAASSRALAAALSEDEISNGCLMPEVSRLWEVCGDVALAVARQAIEDGVARFTQIDQLESKIAENRWEPKYPEIVTTDL
jgi:malate dehydrogenase (oxaloacetate-decarboxylating)